VTAHYNSQFGPIKELLASNTNLQHVQANLSQEQAVVTMFESLSTMPYGPVQVVVVNHAVSHRLDVPIARMTLDQWNTTMTVNLTSSFLVCREYLKHLEKAPSILKEKAAILLIGSTAGKCGEANNGDYAAAKSGQWWFLSALLTWTHDILAMMYGLNLTLKNEIVKIAPKGRVNCIAPGWVKTPMVEEVLKDPQTVSRILATSVILFDSLCHRY
jgi:NAD(P)-dependent dehydrogenase (short-subunit alcohol dehydrogenase family)